jgi:mannose-6-phosphate isomerase-like protein (cupin superfamily)
MPDDDRQWDFSPGMAMRWEITRNTADSGGELFEATNWVGPRMGGPPVHVHPSAEESYAVIEGRLDVFIDGDWSTISAGERASVPAGVPHTLRNATDQTVRLVNVHQPAQRFEAFFRQMRDLIKQGKIKSLPPKDPRSAMYVAMLFRAYPEEIRVVKPPNTLFGALAAVGKAFRLKLDG